MSFSYIAPGITDKDTVRFLIQDTTESDAALSDEEIQYAISSWMPVYNSLYYVASTLADTIAARYAREASYSADGVSVSLGPVGDQYRALAASLRTTYASSRIGAMPDAGGMTPDEPMIPGTKPFSFGKGLHDYVEAGPQEYGGVYPPDQSVDPIGPPYEEIVAPTTPLP